MTDFDNFLSWAPDLDAVIHPNESASLDYRGIAREDAAGVTYGPVSFIVGDLPRIPPSGIEERPVELFLKPTRGDLNQLPDSGIDDFSAQAFYRPSWLFPS